MQRNSERLKVQQNQNGIWSRKNNQHTGKKWIWKYVLKIRLDKVTILPSSLPFSDIILCSCNNGEKKSIKSEILEYKLMQWV